MSRPLKAAEAIAPEHERPVRSAGASHCYHTTIRVHGSDVGLPFRTRTRPGTIETFGATTDEGLLYINGAAHPVLRLSDRLWETVDPTARGSTTSTPTPSGSADLAHEDTHTIASGYDRDGRLVVVDPRFYPRHLSPGRTNWWEWLRSDTLPKPGEPRWILVRGETGVETDLWHRSDHTLLLGKDASFWDGQAVPFGRQLAAFLGRLLSRLSPLPNNETDAERLTSALTALLSKAAAGPGESRASAQGSWTRLGDPPALVSTCYHDGTLVIAQAWTALHYPWYFAQLPTQAEPGWSLVPDTVGANLWLTGDRHGCPSLYARFYTSPFAVGIGEFLVTLLNRLSPTLNEEADAERLAAALEDLLQQANALSPASATAETVERAGS
jgi:hypothetical protein